MNNNIESSILIVDDNPKNLQILATMLRNKKYKVAMVKDGFKALNFIAGKQPDLVLLDIMMPDLDGFEVCRQLKNNENTKNIPIIFISALADIDDKVKAFKAGGIDYITKPFQKEEVLARVKTHLELKHAYESLQKAYEDIEIAARTDSLTKLSNRRDIIEKMKYEKTRSERSGKAFSLVLSDIDDFKTFNDRYGHDCGDFILVNVANIIRNGIRKQDSAARWGGEEFLFLLPETGLSGGQTVAKTIKKKLYEYNFDYQGRTHDITMTFGVSTWWQGQSIDECIKMADNAMYKGKRAGKNCIILSDNL